MKFGACGRRSRRAVLKGGAALGVGLSGRHSWAIPAQAEVPYLTVLCPLPPDPTPPGVGDYGVKAFANWQKGFRTPVYYEGAAWSRLYEKLVANFEQRVGLHDLYYMCGWIPEFSDELMPLDGLLSKTLSDDLPASSWNAVTWNQETLGVVSTLSLLTLFYNKEHFELAGVATPPANWDELKRVAAELTRDGRYGWASNYGAATGIGSSASTWMALLQQAGGTMYDATGDVAFNDAPAVDALQLLMDLMPWTAPGSLIHSTVGEASVEMETGRASMMMNWPFMWQGLNGGVDSAARYRLGAALLPAGPAGSASVDGADSWSVGATSKAPELSVDLLHFFLDRDVQIDQALKTGWLPIRRSALLDEEVQSAFPHAAALHEQSNNPYNSFVTPDYDAITGAIATEIWRALSGRQSAADAIGRAADHVQSIVNGRVKE
jgi:multiple sugar transport system substrate-binding protein